MDGADSAAGTGLDALVQAAARGDGEAFGRLWAALSPAVAAYFRAHAVPDADDLTSEVFLAAFRTVGTVTGGAEQFRGLLFRIAHRRYVDWVRRRVGRGPHLSYEPDLDARTSESAEDCAVDRLGTRRALALLDLLTPDQRQVVSLRVLGDLSLQQTAEVLGRDVGTVKSLQHRGLARLRRGVEQQRTGPGPQGVRPAEESARHPYPEPVPVRLKPRHV
jgi:RNA polymerase sigma-70 factor (ECF subfamily)